MEMADKAAPPPYGSRPNLILIIADDVSASDIGCYGNPDVRTPNLDRLAAEGQMWSRAYLTASVCSPSRCSIITGRYPHNTGAAELHTALPEGQPLFPRQLREIGYWTAQAGKWHLGGYAKEAFDKVVEDKTLNGDSGCEQWVPLLRQRPRDKPFFLWLAYYDEVQRLDRFVGLVTEELQAQGVLNKTLILFISDNGRPFP
jgi:arylsulfatase A-like enzyme